MRAHLHLLSPDSERLGREHDEPLDAREGWYDHAATLEVEPQDDVEDTLQDVWRLTQHERDRPGPPRRTRDPGGAGDWAGNAEVLWVSGPGLRSSYIGDVIVLEGPDSRAAYEIALVGFRRIDLPAEQIHPAGTPPPLPPRSDRASSAE